MTALILETSPSPACCTDPFCEGCGPLPFPVSSAPLPLSEGGRETLYEEWQEQVRDAQWQAEDIRLDKSLRYV